MSKDIRSFFLPKKVQPKIEDDDDVIPESPDVQIKNKKKESRKKRVLSDDSDDEIFNSKKKKAVESTTSQKNKGKSPKATLKEVKVVDIFGLAPIKRTESSVKKPKKTETGIHSDEDFDKSLLEIDKIEDVISKEINKASTSDRNELSNKREKSPTKSEIKPDIDDVKSKNRNKSDPRKELKRASKEESKKKFSVFVESSDHEEDESKIKNTQKSEENNVEEKTLNDNIADKLKNNDDFNESNANMSMLEEHEGDRSINKKKQHNRSLNESVLTDEERHERKIHSAALYQKYLNRSGPKHLGAKQIPEGAPDCLKGCAFLLTGVLDSFEREEVIEAINKFGGCVKNSISKKVTHVLAGEDAGPAKMAKAQEFGIKIIGENDFIEMIKGRKPDSTTESKKEIKKEKTPSKSSKEKKSPKEENIKSVKIKTESDREHTKSAVKVESVKKRDKSKSPYKTHKKEETIKLESDHEKSKSKSESQNLTNQINGVDDGNKIENNLKPTEAAMWVEKYKPQNVKQIIGQHGDASNVKKLTNWLTKWYVNRKAKLPKPSPWAKADDGGYYKAVLLSGPPGVGKTTTVALVCKELGFDVVEFNASDTRNKTLIREQIGELLTTNSLSAYAKGDTSKQAVTKKHVLVMDEVDGMAGNEDRGGLQELITLIKSTSVPIICMCNDRNSQKMRSLVNYCYDLRFSRPRVEQIKSAMMSICFKEGIKIPPDVLTQLIVSANQDVRQTLNLLSMWAVSPSLTDPERLRKDAQGIKKDIKLGPWEAVRKVFSEEDHKTMSIHDKSDLFFYDYSLAPLFVQENYLQVAPHCPKHEVLQRISNAADSISLGDLVDSRIRRNQAWSLLPLQAMYSSVIPGHEMAGHVTGQIQFPAWLGKTSRANKMHRLCQEIHAHTRLSTTGSKLSIYLDYCKYLRDAIVNPLIKDKADGIEKSLEVLESYHLLREDLESLTELSLWPGQRNPTILIDPKVKAAMTRTYNKKATALPYAPGAIKRGRAREEDAAEDDETPDQGTDDSDPENDALIKKKKTKDSEKPSSSKEKPSCSKGKTSSKEKKGKKK